MDMSQKKSMTPTCVEYSTKRSSDTAARRLRLGLAATLFATGIVAVESGTAAGASRSDPGTVVEARNALEAEFARAHKGTPLLLKAPEPGAESEAASAKRTEAARRRVGTLSPLPAEVRTIIVPYTGGPLPPEAMDAPPGTVVLLEYVAGASASDWQAVPDVSAVEAGPPSLEVVGDFGSEVLNPDAASSNAQVTGGERK